MEKGPGSREDNMQGGSEMGRSLRYNEGKGGPVLLGHGDQELKMTAAIPIRKDLVDHVKNSNEKPLKLLNREI